jgi:protein AFG1
MRVQKGGGASSSMMSTYIGNTEWSATGLAEASLATGGAGETDVGFAIGRAVSRLHEMGSAMYGKMD